MRVSREQLVAAFGRAGFELWVVGGDLRDQILGIGGGDEDFATNAGPDQVEALARALGANVTTVGKRFGTIGVLLDGRWTEITTFRGDSYAGGTRWPEVTFGASIEEDLARRDFTINALAREAGTGRELDLYGGRADIAARVIRAVGEPERRFREDPLRILRGLRFAAKLGFEIEPATLAGMAATVELLATLSQERITAELDKLIQAPQAGRGLELMRDVGALPVILPELVPMVGCEQNHWHQFDVWGHTAATVQAMMKEGPHVRARCWGALLHDLGKPAVRHVKKDGEWGFYRHDAVGYELAGPLLDRLKLAHKDAAIIRLLVQRHMDRPNIAERRSVRRFIAKSGGYWEDLIALKRADNASHTYDDNAYHDALESYCRQIVAEDEAALRAESPLTGDDLVAMFQREPGPWIKAIKARLSALVLDGELAPGDRANAERIVRQSSEFRVPGSEC
ncbi:MAG: CCA tRNA nucleotidyltransferase [Chloroflexi bacterium]|nr:CCA tRNA nucleotidyltransferase [Chloroflexota bacterium]